MNFDFLFQINEGVYSLTKRKTKILSFTSLAGFLSTVAVAVVYSFNANRVVLLPGVAVMAVVFGLMAFFVFRGKPALATKTIYLLPIAMYLLFINTQGAFPGEEVSAKYILTFSYLGLIFLLSFSDTIVPIIVFYLETEAVLVYFLYVNDLLSSAKLTEIQGQFINIHPIIELTIVLCLSLFFFLNYRSIKKQLISERRRMEKLIDESFRQFNAAIVELSVKRNEKGETTGFTIKKVNRYFEKTFNISNDNIRDVDYAELYETLFRDSFNWQEIYFNRHQKSQQISINHLDKSFELINIYPTDNIIISYFFNITELKKEVLRSKERERRLTELMGSLPDIFFIIENDGTYVDYVSNNPKLIKLSQNDIIGKTIFDMGFSQSMTFQIYASIQYVIEHDNIETIEYGMELPNGKKLIFEMRLARLNETQVISIGRDITSNKEYESQLIEAKKKTEEASRLKSSFLENISHEIRTPMNAILGFTNMAVTGEYSETENKKFLDIVLRNGEYLMNIITDIIDISELESHSIVPTYMSSKVNPIFYTTYKKFYEMINQKGIKINFELIIGNTNEDFAIETDSYLLSKIINHLVDNAIKFTKKGSVVFGYEQNEDQIIIFVQDTGIGIQKEDFQSIFELFHQIDNRVSRTYTGTGAGLRIAKGLTELLGSKINFESEPGKGSKFFFTLSSANNYRT